MRAPLRQLLTYSPQRLEGLRKAYKKRLAFPFARVSAPGLPISGLYSLRTPTASAGG